MTDTTLDLFADRDPSWLVSPSTKLERRFARFHVQNPQLYQQFEMRALEAFDRGATRIGIKAIAERIRWDIRIRVLGDDYKVNNSYVALYARLLIHRHPKLLAVIETRKRAA